MSNKQSDIRSFSYQRAKQKNSQCVLIQETVDMTHDGLGMKNQDSLIRVSRTRAYHQAEFATDYTVTEVEGASLHILMDD